MKMALSSALTATIFSVSAHSEEIAIYGLTLGAELPASIHECAKGKYGYEPLTKFLCFEDVPTHAFTRISFPADQAPLVLKNLSINAYHIAKKIEKIEFFTYGPDSDGLVMETLSKKFGKPKNTSIMPVQNAMGATFSKHIASWSVGDVNVEYSSVWNKINTGRVEITTANWRVMEQQQNASEDKKRIPM